MAWESRRQNAGGAPTAEQFRYRDGSGIDYAAFNAAVQQYNQEQEMARYNQGLQMLQNVAGLFSDNGAYDQSYRNAKNKFMSQSASDMTSRGMANLVNAPAMGLSYDREVRPEFEMQRQNRLASAMTAMAEYMGSFRPQFAPQGMSYSRTANPSGGSGFSPFGGFAPSTSAPREAMGSSMASSPFEGVSFRRQAGAGNAPPASFRPSEYMMGANEDWRRDTFLGTMRAPFSGEFSMSQSLRRGLA